LSTQLDSFFPFQVPSHFQHQDPSSQSIFMDCSACQAQSMAAILIKSRDGGPILSLTGEQCTE
jgi:hypothetical protein